MIKMRLWIAQLLWILAILTVNGQQVNPFDIANRNEVINKPLRQDTSIQNQNTLAKISPSVSEQKTNEEIATREESNQESISISEGASEEELSFLERQQKKLLNSNPFNVSHIPIKKGKKSAVAERKSEKTLELSEEVSTPDANNEVDISRTKTSKPINANKFIFWLLLLQLLLITSLLGINREIIRKISRSISNDNFAKLVSRDYNGGYNALFVILYILFFFSLSIFIYLLFRNNYGLNGFSKYLLVLLSVIGVYGFRHIFQGFSGYIFPFGKTSSYYNFMIILFNSFLGLILIPVNVIVAYAPSGLANFVLYLGVAAIVIMYLLRFLRGSLHAYTYVRNYLFHFFLYLCTCEFAPVVILVKFLSKSFIN